MASDKRHIDRNALALFEKNTESMKALSREKAKGSFVGNAGWSATVLRRTQSLPKSLFAHCCSKASERVVLQLLVA